MLAYIWYRDDATGLLDDEHKDGDVGLVFEDSHVPGALEPKAYLIVKVPDPPNLPKVMTEIVKSEYIPGATPGSAHETRHMRKYKLDWRPHFNDAEIAIITDGAQQLPDGPLLSGGIVTSGIVEQKFTFEDFRRK